MNKTQKQSLFWAIFFIFLLVGSSAFIWYTDHIPKEDDGSKIANIYINGKLDRKIDLNKVTTPYQIRYNSEDGGYNIVEVRHGSIRIAEADCHDQICVHEGEIHDDGKPIVCLPHKLVITIDHGAVDHHAKSNSPDTISR